MAQELCKWKDKRRVEEFDCMELPTGPDISPIPLVIRGTFGGYNQEVPFVATDGSHAAVAQYLYASALPVLLSSSSGVSWGESSTLLKGFQIVGADDLSYLILSTNDKIYKSSGGSTWTETTLAPGQYKCIGSNADGSVMVAYDNYTYLAKISRNYGATWSTLFIGPDESRAAAYISPDGNVIAFSFFSGNGIKLSLDGGASWSTSGNFSSSFITATPNGQYIFAIYYAAYFMFSSDYGASFTTISIDGVGGFYFEIKDIAVNEDASRILIFAKDYMNNVYRFVESTDYGESFYVREGSHAWYGARMNASLDLETIIVSAQETSEYGLSLYST